MNHSQSYERVLPIRPKGKQLSICISLFFSYLLVAMASGLLFLNTLNPYVAALGILLTLTLFLLTRKYLRVEYEYAFAGGSLTIAKIYGKRTRKTVAEIDLSHLLFVDYDTEEARQNALRMNPEETILALSDPQASPALLLLWEINQKERKLLCMESDDRTEQLLRRNYPHVCSIDIKKGTHRF